ncbi:alpha/beta hydrolase [Nocardia sp. NPDC049149]|uniref:alpha/beta hydrolase n=1 Tax=Nocardia sp. NPDC049149 TaxID=3364315 RepID=UPI0037107450
MTSADDQVSVRHRFIRGRHGTLLHLQSWLPGAPARAVVQIAHGLGDHVGRHDRLATVLARAGYAVYALDQRGHGYSDGPRATIRRFRDVVADLAASVNLANDENPELPTYLIGHSWGGLVSLAYVAQQQPRLSGMVLAATAGSARPVPAAQRVATAALAHVLPRLGTRKLPFELATRDPAAAAAFHTDKLAYRRRVRAATAAQSLTAMHRLHAQLPAITVPILLLHGTADAIAAPATSSYVHDRVGSPDRTLVLFDGLYHQLFNEPERAVVTTTVLDWLADRHRDRERR